MFFCSGIVQRQPFPSPHVTRTEKDRAWRGERKRRCLPLVVGCRESSSAALWKLAIRERSKWVTIAASRCIAFLRGASSSRLQIYIPARCKNTHTSPRARSESGLTLANSLFMRSNYRRTSRRTPPCPASSLSAPGR